MTGAQVDRVTNPDRLTAPPGVHLWTTMVAFQVHQPARWSSEEQHLDMENMLYVSPPGCFVCEQVWTPGLELTACPGDPGVG